MDVVAYKDGLSSYRSSPLPREGGLAHTFFVLHWSHHDGGAPHLVRSRQTWERQTTMFSSSG